MTKKETRPAANGTDHPLTSNSLTTSPTSYRCVQCGKTKQLAEMAPDRRRKNGRRSVCRDCRSAYDHHLYRSKQDRILARQHQYRKENPGVGWAAHFRRRATRFGFTPSAEVFTLGDLTANWGDRCVYCATGPFEQIDHIMPVAAGGQHVLTNVVPCCKKCNQWKRWAFDERVIRWYRAGLDGEPWGQR